ncbi:MAG TPA: hypothetical protein VGD88_09650 [Opitutaceae bacterium]
MFSLSIPWKEVAPKQWNSINRRWALHGISHLLLRRHLGRKPRPGGFISLSRDNAEAFLGNPMGSEALGALGPRGLGLLECDNAYERGIRSNGYRFSAAGVAFGPKVLEAPKKLGGALLRARGLDAPGPVARQMWETLRTMEWSDEARPALEEHLAGADLVSGLCALLAYETIRRGNWGLKSGKKVDRLFHPVGNCSKLMRPHLLMAGRPTGEADIASSQPFFLATMAYRGDTSAEAQGFRDLVTSPSFYEQFAAWVGLAGGDRERIKRRFLTEVLFGELKYRGKMWEALALRFPKLAQYVERVKCDDYRALAIQLQNEEARVVLGCVVPGLASRGIEAVSIHDGLLVKREHLAETREFMASTIERETGLRPLVR